jgi:hypothetical protein
MGNGFLEFMSQDDVINSLNYIHKRVTTENSEDISMEFLYGSKRFIRHVMKKHCLKENN